MKLNVKNTQIKKFIEQKELNILVSNIYNSYLTECRYLVNEQTVLSHKDEKSPIYGAFLEALEIDPDDNQFLNLAKQYKIDNIKKLDNEEFENNPYVKNIKITNDQFKNWVLHYSEYKPYECFLYDDIEVLPNSFYKEITPFGYFEKPFKFIEVEENDVTWMPITPHEINTMKEPLSKVKGKILVLGLGLGYFPYMASLKNEVSSITIIEKDKKVIDLIEKNILPQFDSSKIKIICDDAFSYLETTEETYDYVFCDLYHNANDGLEIYIKTKALENRNGKTVYLYWIEKNILALLRRCVLLIFEEKLEGYNDYDYEKSSCFEDTLINKLYKILKNSTFDTIDDIKNLLSDENLISLVDKINDKK